MKKLDLYQGIVLKYISLLLIMSKYLIHVPLLYTYMGKEESSEPCPASTSWLGLEKLCRENDY